MVYELKKHFDKKFIELQKSMDVNKNTLENFKSGIKVDLQKLEDKIGNKIKALESNKKSLQQQITAMAKQSKETQKRYDKLEQDGHRFSIQIDSVPKQNNQKTEDVFKTCKNTPLKTFPNSKCLKL